METRNLTCIGCPLGCAITVTMDGGNVVSITGNTCKRGSDYAAKEVTHPTRIVTSTVCVRGGSIPMVSVKTAQDIPKEKIFEIMKYINALTVTAPVHIGDVLLKDIAGTGVDLIATKEVPVSYTHLDVYKRQTLFNPQFQETMRRLCLFPFSPVCPA